MNIFFLIFLFLTSVFGKMPENPESYVCPRTNTGQTETKPVFLHQTNEKHVIGICGDKEIEANNFSKITVYAFPDTKKPIFKNTSKDKKFLVMEKRDGILLIEKVKVDKEYVELFHHELDCDKDKCGTEKELCIAVNKVKKKWIFQKIKDFKIKSRMKKLGCA